ncbi:hypothetical protein BN000_04361 [Mycobacterium europaeum]|uniref:Uncharacterized protein n=1 Tax=Mycobacterium europaeum TaxID=761804 RepID=A0A0U1DNB4_9MYCO|nr:hypothetical protein [Mycobacterium europaeum]CQD18947.1 hypothetical protein BN000_04361 [Mycobacterium europaeum]
MVNVRDVNNDTVDAVWLVTFTEGRAAAIVRAGTGAAVIALIESPQVCSPKFLTCEQGSV